MSSNSENQAAHCYQQLIAGMQQAEILPGDYLREQTLAQEFGVSRTPVREALRKLETEGLVQSEPRLGMRVRTLDYQEVIELYEVREVHERAVARLAATKATTMELDELKALQADLEKAKHNPKKMAPLNLRFHVALLRMAKNRFLTRAVETMQRTILLLGPSTLNDPKRAETAIKEHRSLIKALQSGDADKAEAIMSAHLQNAQRSRIRQIQREPFGG
ncbi:MAG: GntR family transcriptional regulator [Granulosicoccus sp.]